MPSTLSRVGERGCCSTLLFSYERVSQTRAASSAFAEHAAPGLIELFSSRANDLSVELSVHPTSRFRELITSRAVDIALGQAGEDRDGTTVLGTEGGLYS